MPLIASYMFMSMSSKTRASRPVGSSLHTEVKVSIENVCVTNKRGNTGRWHLLENFVELDDLGVGTEAAECLDLPEVVDLLDVVEVVLHALDGHVLARLYALGLQDLGKCSLALL